MKTYTLQVSPYANKNLVKRFINQFEPITYRSKTSLERISSLILGGAYSMLLWEDEKELYGHPNFPSVSYALQNILEIVENKSQ